MCHQYSNSKQQLGGEGAVSHLATEVKPTDISQNISHYIYPDTEISRIFVVIVMLELMSKSQIFIEIILVFILTGINRSTLKKATCGQRVIKVRILEFLTFARNS